MNIPENTDEISTDRTVSVTDIGEVYDFVIEELFQYSESDMESFDLTELDDKRNAIRVVLIGPKSIHNNRIESLAERMVRVGDNQATIESVQINYLSDDTLEEDNVVYALKDNTERIKFELEKE